MSAAAAPPTTAWNWPADLLAHARAKGVEAVLEPLLEATRRTFPTARTIRTYLDPDAALPELNFLVYEVRVTRDDVPDVLAAHRRWNDELFHLMPRPVSTAFVLDLQREPAQFSLSPGFAGEWAG